MGALTRRGVLTGGAGVLGVGAVGGLGWQVAPGNLRIAIRERVGLAPEAYVPDVPQGRVRLETVRSASMGTIDLFSAVPAGYGEGEGLPVVVVLHGASASAAALRDFELGRFVTAAVRAGTPPFVLAGTDDGPAGWVRDGTIDPQAMLAEELPAWLDERGWDSGRKALWGWSRGGYGALRMIAAHPTWAGPTALFSPALHHDEPLLEDPATLRALEGRSWGLWCGEDDPFRDGAEALAAAAPTVPDPDVAGPGGHTRSYWNDHTLAMFDFVGRALATPS